MSTSTFNTLSEYSLPPVATDHGMTAALRHELDVDSDKIGCFPQRWPVILPIVGLILFSLLIRWTDLDLWVAGFFYDRSLRVWPYELSEPWLTIYRQGTLPSFVLGIGGVIVALFGPWLPW